MEKKESTLLRAFPATFFNKLKDKPFPRTYESFETSVMAAIHEALSGLGLMQMAWELFERIDRYKFSLRMSLVVIGILEKVEPGMFQKAMRTQFPKCKGPLTFEQYLQENDVEYCSLSGNIVDRIMDELRKLPKDLRGG